MNYPWSKESLSNFRLGLKKLKSDSQTLKDILQQISHHSLSTRFDIFRPILGENWNNILIEPKFKEKKERISIDSGLKIPIPRLGGMNQNIQWKKECCIIKFCKKI